MMPTSVAIVSSVFPRSRRGSALGVLAGGAAFFAALGPVLGGLLTSIDWRLVFAVNVPLAALAAGLTARYTPDLRPEPSAERSVDVRRLPRPALRRPGRQRHPADGRP